MSDSKKSSFSPTKEQIDNIILPAYTEMAKLSVSYINQFECPPEYVADMLRDIADALVQSHPNSEANCTCCDN